MAGTRPSSWTLDLLAVAGGGVVGTLLRAAGLHAFPPEPGSVPWVTLGENLLGAFFLGVLTTWLLHRHGERPRLQLFLMPGVLGSFTTFSALALDGAILLQAAPTVSALYLTLSLMGGVAFALTGLAVGRHLTSRGGALP